MHHAATCPTCQANALTRNHYFTGKLMVERDFTDEQHYFRERLRLHNQRLHGSGVACGLAVKQHPNPACQTRYVLLEPGSAVDCCGNDILVTAEDTIDLLSFPAVKALENDTSQTDHVLQIAICYRECPTEEIPVLYDDCACDDSQCAPNRILESYSIDVIVDPQTPAAPTAGQPSLARDGTLWIAAPLGVAVDDAGGLIYVLTAGSLYQIDATTQVLLTSVSLATPGLALAISPDGKTVYVATKPGTGPDGSMSIYNTADLTHPQTAAVSGASSGTPFLAVTSQAQVVAAYPNGQVTAWLATDAVGTPSGTAALATGISGLAVSSDGKTAWLARNSASVQSLTLGAGPFTPQSSFLVSGTGAELTVLAVLRSTAPDKLAAADATNKILYVIDPSVGTTLASASLAAAPIAMVAAPGGSWLYVDDANGAIEVIDVGSLLQNLPVTPPPPFAVGANTVGLVISASGQRLYVPYEGTASDGGVAIIDVSDTDCGAALHEVRACPDCGNADCVVLATIRGYQYGWQLLDPTDPPSNPTTDDQNHIARIDDLDGRKILASTETLQDVIECLLAHGGGSGTQGLQGPPGTNGTNGTNGANGTNGTNGTNGKNGVGLTQNVTRIIALSWTHGGTNILPIVTFEQVQYQALIIQFSNKIKIIGGDGSGNDQPYYCNVFQVEAPHDADSTYLCSCRLVGTVIAVSNITLTSGVITGANPSTAPAEGMAFLLPQALKPGTLRGNQLSVHLLGEFVVDSNGNAIAADFIRASLPTGDIRMAPGQSHAPVTNPNSLYGIPGGRFDSWFTVQNNDIFKNG